MSARFDHLVVAVEDLVRHFDGSSSSGRFAESEQQLLDDAVAGRRTDGVVRGEPWL